MHASPASSITNGRTFSLPVPLPPEMRTRRSRARLFACLCLIGWAIVYTLGVRELYKQAAAAKTAVDAILVQGDHDWLLIDRRSGSCAGLLRSSLRNEHGKPRFSLNGRARLGDTAPTNTVTSELLRFHVDVAFGRFYELIRADADANLGERTWTIRSEKDQSDRLFISTGGEDQAGEFFVPLPSPLFLNGRARESYRLTFKEEHPLDTTLAVDEQLGLWQGRFELREARSDETSSCEEQLENGTSANIPADIQQNLRKSVTGGH